jgi:hypothetical protein
MNVMKRHKLGTEVLRRQSGGKVKNIPVKQSNRTPPYEIYRLIPTVEGNFDKINLKPAKNILKSKIKF